MKTLPLLLLIFASLAVSAQFHYAIDQSIPVELNGKELAMPWAGGFNSAQINTIDINNDKKQDLVVFDKGAGKIWTYLGINNSYRYAPEYESLFPPEVYAFVLLRDYNCDGKKDLFTFNSNINGITVYKNTTVAGSKLSWQKIQIYTGISQTEILLTKGFSGLVNILPGIDDVPNIADMDGDGDLDILNMRFVNPSTAEYHKNFSMERYGKCDSLVFERQTQRWGDWEECSCGVIAFGQTCAQLSGSREGDNGRVEHSGGKALLALDMNNDGNKDVLYSEESCARIYYMPNQGTSEAALMKTSSLFPSTNPVGIAFFPVPYLEDVDFDGKPDLLVSPNLNSRTTLNTNFAQSLWYYRNTGTVQQPTFTFTKTNFLQEEMIDVGDNSVPAFTDADGDGDLDMFIGTYTSTDFTGRIIHYENTGTNTQPAFRFVTDNFGSIGLLQLYNVKPHFADADGNGTTDLVFTATSLQNGVTSLYYLPNKNKEGLSVPSAEATPLNFNLGFSENVVLNDVNKDGKIDLLIGKSTGELQYWENSGAQGTFNVVLKNSSFLNLGITTARQNLSLAIADMDADGLDELVTGDQRGELTVYNNFRSTNPVPQGVKDLVLDTFTESYVAKNLGGRAWPTVANLYNTNKPLIAVGNTTGGVYLLKSDDSYELPPEPVIILSPNPLDANESLNIIADRNVTLQIFSLLGQKMSEPLFIPANQSSELTLHNLAVGMYIARFTYNGKSYGKKFVIRYY